MDLRLLGSTFVSIFLAELGDKTQLATMGLSTQGSRWTVFLGSALALVVSSALAVLAGDLISRVVPPIWLRRGAGALFVVMGILLIARDPEGSEAAPGTQQVDQR
ncbi:MAG: TMEM165/GDT1 family protein [Deltaproteobacteria bacterium]|nr:TMEM165/GDT1 family protein [Deltaproteobacteria bacterium]